MGAPAGHVFFGNQYTTGGYVKGSFTYTVEAVKKITEAIAKNANPAAFKTSQATSFGAKMWHSIVHWKSAIFGVAIVVTVAAGVYFVVKHVKQKSSKKDGKGHVVEIEYVGVCEQCEIPLSDASLYPGDADKGILSFLECKQCGKRNVGQLLIE